MVLMEAGSYPTKRASSRIVASAEQRIGKVIDATDVMAQIGRLFPDPFMVSGHRFAQKVEIPPTIETVSKLALLSFSCSCHFV
jgi:hypothetical protein